MTKGDSSPSQKVTKKFSPANYYSEVTQYVFSARLRLKTATHRHLKTPTWVLDAQFSKQNRLVRGHLFPHA